MSSLYQTVRFRSPSAVFRDQDGDWVNSQRGAAVISPELRGRRWRSVEQQALDFWCYGYRPRAGDVVVDVGAGVGEETVVFSRLVGPTGRVVSVEAHPVTHRCLGKTVRRNHLSNVVTVEAAVCRSEGQLRIDDSTFHLGNRVTVDASSRGPAVEGLTLGALMKRAEVTSVSLLKMNIEGAESDAIAGATDVLPRVKNVVISCHDFLAEGGGDASLRTFADVRRQLQQAGFVLTFRPDDPRPWARYYVYGVRG